MANRERNTAPVKATGPSIAELEEALLIDEHALDEALERQPDFFYQVAKELATKISDRDEAKIAFERAEAECDAEIREAHAEKERKAAEKDEKPPKLTEGGIKALIAQDETVAAAKDKFLRLSREVGQWSALKEAYVQRSHALSKLGDLFVANYFDNGMASRGHDGVKNRNADDARRMMNRERRKE